MPRGKEQLVNHPVNQPCVKDLQIFVIGDADSSVKRNNLAPTISVVKNLSPSEDSSFSLNHLPNAIPDKFWWPFREEGKDFQFYNALLGNEY